MEIRKNILGLDIGTNSIGWALLDKAENSGTIIGTGSRIIPMSQDILGKFDSGVSVSQTAERTTYRRIRRMYHRRSLRRQRLLRILHKLGFLPPHYAAQINFTDRPGQFLAGQEPLLPYAFNEHTGRREFIFHKAYSEMMEEFRQHHPAMLEGGKKLPHDWTIYYLRKKALSRAVSPEELAWLLLHFNQKRGYYQLRDDSEEINSGNKEVKYYSLKVTDVVDSGERNKKGDTSYQIYLENGWSFFRPSATAPDWTGKTKDFIITTDLNEDGSIKTGKDGQVRRSFRAPGEEDWGLLKIKTEQDIKRSHVTVGAYIYNHLLAKPDVRIKGKLVRVIERKFYKEELELILEAQKKYHAPLNNQELLEACILELYPHNQAHREHLTKQDFTHLMLNDILFYQRPLKSKKSLIADCRFERRAYIKEGQKLYSPVKAAPRSHPLAQEFRVWQFIQNLRIYEKALPADRDVTESFLGTADSRVALFNWLNDRKEVDQSSLLKQLTGKKKVEGFRWNYPEDKTYPANETRAAILSRLTTAKINSSFLTAEKEEFLWHILYSVDDPVDLRKALTHYAQKNELGDDFVEAFLKFPRLDKEYAAYSTKALKKLLALMREGSYWNEAFVIQNFDGYQKNIAAVLRTIDEKETRITDEQRAYGKAVNERLRDAFNNLGDAIGNYQGIPHHIACYLVYGRHAESSETGQWKTPASIDKFLTDFRQHSLRNPIAEQVILETLRVVRDIWIRFGNGEPEFFDEIHVELGRELRNPAAERERISKRNTENENTNLRIRALLQQLQMDGSAQGIRPHSIFQQEKLRLYEEGALSNESRDLPDDILRISRMPSPTPEELKRYRLWLEQGYHSPYTGKIIPLSKLFTPAYEIEHIVPQSRYFDDSLGNKVLCEADVNQHKDNDTAYAYIKKMGGAKVAGSTEILTKELYEQHVRRFFSGNRSKMKKLLTEDIPDNFVERQLNDTRYISKYVKNLLSHIVREENEQEVTAKKMIAVPGSVTSRLRLDWGLESIWSELIAPRYQRMNAISGTRDYGSNSGSEGHFIPEVPLHYRRGYNRKRIDHRHHALDAIVVAAVTREHINYLSSLNSERINYSLVGRLREITTYEQNGEKRKAAGKFLVPWKSFAKDTREALEKIVISFKQNLRVLTQTNNRYQAWEKTANGWQKVLKKQAVGDNLAIRKSLHKETVAGLVRLKLQKEVSVAMAAESWSMVVDPSLKQQLKLLHQQGRSTKEMKQWLQQQVSDGMLPAKIAIYYWAEDKDGQPAYAATRKSLTPDLTLDDIRKITDTGIQQILLRHLERYAETIKGKRVDHPELAFSPDGLDSLNRNIQSLNNNKPHKPIYKVRFYEPKGNKFPVGYSYGKKDKYVEANKGTNLFFGVYLTPEKKRVYDTIPLNIVIERLKQKLPPVPETDLQGNRLLFHLSPNDLVYVPGEDEGNVPVIAGLSLTPEQVPNVYKMVSSTGNQCFFVRHEVAVAIVNKIEFGPNNKMERALDGTMIKERCFKLKVDRLGHAVFA